MRWCLAVVLVAGCDYRSGAVSSGDGGTVSMVDAPATFDDGGHELVPWILETPGDFTKLGADPGATMVQPFGGLTEGGYVYGGLVVHGLAGTQLWNQPPYAWASIVGHPPTGTSLWPAGYWNSSSSLTHSLGVDTSQAFSLWLEGDVYLNPNEKLWLNAGVAGFIDVRPSATAPFMQAVAVMKSGINGTTSAWSAPAAGWYAIRIGYASDGGTGVLDFRASPPGQTRSFTRSQIRAPGDLVSGLLRTAFRDQVGAGASPVLYAEQTGLDGNLDGNAIVGSDTSWSATWNGQLYSPAGGSYTITAASDDGNRLTLAGQQGSDHWGVNQQNSSNSQVTTNLAAGWNDLTIEYNNAGSNPGDLHVKIAASPEGSNLAVPMARLRAVEPSTRRMVTGGDPGSHAVPTNGQTQSQNLAFDGFAGETTTGIRTRFQVTAQHMQDITVDLKTPGGTINLCTSCGQGALTIAFYLPNATSEPVAGNWQFVVTNNGNQSASLDSAWLTVYTHGGADSIARTASWTSQVIDNGGATGAGHLFQIDRVAWTERTTAAGPATIELRSCTAPDCSDGTWVTATQGGAPTLPLDRYLQSRITLVSDGTHDSELQKLEIDYRRTH